MRLPLPPRRANSVSPLPSEFLNCYTIEDLDSYGWAVAIYRFSRIAGGVEPHGERGNLRSIMWDLFKQYKSQCEGWRFAIDVSNEAVAVPASWNIPDLTHDSFRITREKEFKATLREDGAISIIDGILREGIKRVLKGTDASDRLGPLWQDMNAFCQYPCIDPSQEFSFCRRFETSVKRLAGGLWALHVKITTRPLTTRTFADYYSEGRVDELAEMIQATLADRTNRKNRQVSVRVLRFGKTAIGELLPKAIELREIAAILGHSKLSSEQQRALALNGILCSEYSKAPGIVPMNQLHLIVGSQVTQEDHAESILDPSDRHSLTTALRDALNGAEIFGTELRLSSDPLATSNVRCITFAPPSILLKGKDGKPYEISAPAQISAEALKNRAINRAKCVRSNGYLQEYPFNPLLAWPRRLSPEGMDRIKQDLNKILERQGIKYRFRNECSYSNVREIADAAQKHGCDSVFAVLPERRNDPRVINDTHEQIKRSVPLPSQCIYSDRTLPRHLVDVPDAKLYGRNRDMVRRTMQSYEICLLNLLVKHRWVPFAPSKPFNYNIHIGLDVGGKSNDRAFACIGYGFSNPRNGLIFLPKEIPVLQGQAEPIPPSALKDGLRAMFDEIVQELSTTGQKVDLSRVLVFRDGPFLGAGEEWHEFDALADLHREFMDKGLIAKDSSWIALELHKAAEGWRVLTSPNGSTVGNPLVGRAIFPYEDLDNEGLLCTTGQPFLTQGSASPLKFRIRPIHGTYSVNEVLQDTMWEADMCFTKLDMTASLPWILNLADNGALWTARSYQVGGLTA